MMIRNIFLSCKPSILSIFGQTSSINCCCTLWLLSCNFKVSIFFLRYLKVLQISCKSWFLKSVYVFIWRRLEYFCVSCVYAQSFPIFIPMIYFNSFTYLPENFISDFMWNSGLFGLLWREILLFIVLYMVFLISFSYEVPFDFMHQWIPIFILI